MLIDESEFSAGVWAALTAKLEQKGPLDKEVLQGVTSLRITQADSLTGMQNLANLKRLSIYNSGLVSLEELAGCKGLTSLTALRTRLSSVEPLSALEKLRRCTIAFSLIDDISPLSELPSLRRLNVVGNPLSITSYEEVIPALRERGVSVEASTREAWLLQRELVNNGMEAAYWKDEDFYLLTCLTPDFVAASEGTESRYAEIQPSVLETELRQGIICCEELFERYETDFETLRKQKTREATAGAELDVWIDEAGLPEQEAAKLQTYARRFAEHTFVREDPSQLERWARARGPVWDLGLRRLPQWYVAYRRAVGWPEVGDSPALVVLGEPAGAVPANTPFALAPIGGGTRGLRSAVIDRHHIFPIGWGGEDAGWALGIELADETIHRVYAFRAEDAFDWGFDPREHVAFETLGAMFEAVEEVRRASGGPDALSGLGDEPPHIDVEVDALVERGGADQAREWVEAADLPDEFRQALLRFVDGFTGQTFVREDDALLDYYEVLNQVRLPAWYREVRQALAYVERDGRPTSLVFGNWDGWEERPFLMGPAVVNSDVGRKLMHHHELFPFGSAAYHVLVIPMEEDADRPVEWCATDELGRDDFAGVRAFASLAAMFDQVTALKRGDLIVEREG